MRRLVVWLALAFGCGDDHPASLDASTDAAAPELAAPVAAALPRFTPCPEGWTTTAAPEGFDVCEPYPDGIADCADHEAHFVGRPGCERLGTECALADDAAIYVRPGATGGDGSRERPFGTMYAALAVARSGDVVQLSEGVHAAGIALHSSITLRGACVEKTFLRGGIGVESPDVTIENLTLQNSLGDVAIIANGARVHVHDVAMRGGAGGIFAIDGGSVDVTRVRISDMVDPLGELAAGIYIDEGGTVVAHQLFIERTGGAGIYLLDPGSAATLEDLTLSDITAALDTLTTGAIVDGAGAHVEAHRVYIDGAVEAGVNVFSGADLTLGDAVVRNVRSEPSTTDFGYGVLLRAAARLDRVRTERNQTAGIGVQGASVSIADIVARDNVPSVRGDFGRGLGVFLGGAVEGDRIVLAGNSEADLSIETGSSATVRDLFIDEGETHARAGAIYVQDHASLTLERAHIANVRRVGINLLVASTFDGVDVSITDVESDDAMGYLGRGLAVQDDSVATLRRSRLLRTRETSLFVRNATAHLEGVALDETRAAACMETVCAASPGGFGIAAVGTSAIDVQTFRIDDAALCAVLLDRDASLDLASGEIAGAPIGVCLQSPGYDIGRLMNDVRYHDNGVNLDSTELPVPEPVIGL